MTNHQDQIDQLYFKIDILLIRQNDFSSEIEKLKLEIEALKASVSEQETPTVQNLDNRSIPISDSEIKEESKKVETQFQQDEIKFEAPKPILPPVTKARKMSFDLEKFIGENLINKIGIAITVIGVAIGAKYSIENELISPLTRIILGYVSGLALLGIGMKLKKKYENYSAVLVSGAMAIMYFITYSAYGFYDLIPQLMAFGLMLVFTAFTVVAAINYNRSIIAQIGLVGAYAVPFLLSEGSGKVATLFAYMAIINIGILIIAFKKYWKALYYSSFTMTWVIFVFWYLFEYQTEKHFGIALTFLFIFFGIFYLMFLAYKLIRKEKFEIQDIFLLLVNSFIVYGVGFLVLGNHTTGKDLVGVFTLCNALIHFMVSLLIYRQKLADRNLFFLVSGLVLVFITITIPVQLDGNWVTLLWAGEAALMFWIGRTKNVPVYEKLSYPLMILAFISIGHDWLTVYNDYNPGDPGTRITPIFNVNFLSSLLFIAAFGFINLWSRSTKYPSAIASLKGFSNIISFIIPAVFIFTTYYAFHLEIENYWNQLYEDSLLSINSGEEGFENIHRNYDLAHYRTIWILNYSLLFLSILAWLNFKKIKNQQLGAVNLGLLALCLFVFLMQGLFALSELRESYLEQSLSEYYQRGIFNLLIRYISFAFAALGLISCYQYIRQKFMKNNFRMPFDFLLHTSVLWIASSELINWMDIAESTQSYKLGLSILWGVYALLLIGLGIWKSKKHLRIGAIVLFGITLIKLFFYDISHLDTISKTIVLVSLGVLLLIISFLYNKYKHIISNEAET